MLKVIPQYCSAHPVLCIWCVEARTQHLVKVSGFRNVTSGEIPKDWQT